MSYKTKQLLLRRQADAAKWEREHRALWASSSDDRFVSLDDLDIQGELQVAESNPEYILGQDSETLEDWLVGIDYDSAATESQSAVSAFNSFFFNK
jgi:hypothetical protein